MARAEAERRDLNLRGLLFTLLLLTAATSLGSDEATAQDANQQREATTFSKRVSALVDAKNVSILNRFISRNPKALNDCSSLLLRKIDLLLSSPAPVPIPYPTQLPQGDPSIDEAKRKCADLGFVRGTPKFGQCVLKVSE